MKIGKVDTEEISIVVQGPVIWNKDYYETGWTCEVLNRARHFFSWFRDYLINLERAKY